MYRFRKLIVIISLILAIALGYFGFKLPEVLKGNGFDMGKEYAQTNLIMEEDFGRSTNPYIIVFYNKNASSKEDFSSYINETLTEVKGLNGFSKLTSPLEMPTQYKDDIAYALVFFHEKTNPAEITEELRDHLIESKGFESKLTGGLVIEDDMNKSSQTDLKKAEMIGVPIALVVLLLAFGGLVASMIPLISGVISVLASMGVCYFLGQKFDLSVFVLNVTPMVGLALSIDFALLYIHRFREELQTKSVKEAVKKTSQTAGRAIIFSGSCVAIGMSGMFFIDIDIFQSVAMGGITVVILSVLIANTFLPAFLSILGHRINKLMIIKVNENVTKQSGWYRFASFVMKKPFVTTLMALAILLVAIIPIGHIKLEIPDVKALPETSETRTSFEDFQANFIDRNSTDTPFVITFPDEYLVSSPNGTEKVLSEEAYTKVHQWIAGLKKDPLVKSIDSVFSLSQIDDPAMLSAALANPTQMAQLKPISDSMIHENKMIVRVWLDAHYSDTKAKQWVKDKQVANADKPIGDASYLIGGSSKFNQEIFDEIKHKAPYGIAFILISTFLILMFAFKSLIIPIKAVIMNVLSLSAAFGIIVWIFQDGNLGVTPSPIALMIPIFAFSIVFGLSMDYEVFLISRIQEIYLETKDNNYAVLHGLTSTSKIITSAAAIMIAVTGAFAFTEIIPVKQIGIGVALSIFIDATLVRMILVPSLMKILGEWNWWLPFRKNKS